MQVLNMEFLQTLSGKLRIFIILFGIVAVGIMADLYNQKTLLKPAKNATSVVKKDVGGLLTQDKFHSLTNYEIEMTNLAVLILSLIAATGLLVAAIFKLSVKIRRWKIIDGAFHIILGSLLLVGGIWYIIRVKDLMEFYSLAIKYLRDASTIDYLPFYMDPDVLSAEYHVWLAKASSVLALQAIEICLLFFTAAAIFKQKSSDDSAYDSLLSST